MITTTMTPEEMFAAAYQDFLEIRVSAGIAYERFKRARKGQKAYKLIYSEIEERKIQTKSHDVWTLYFKNIGTFHGSTKFTEMAYMPLHRESGTDYLIMYPCNLNRKFGLEVFTSHFLQRYKERYLDFKGITKRSGNLALDFLLASMDRKRAYYLPPGWKLSDLKDQYFLHTSQGLSLVKQTRNLNMHTFITFLDQENLSRYKAQVYEEETVFRLVNFTVKNDEPKTEEEFLKLKAVCAKLMSIPNGKQIFKRKMHRMTATMVTDVSHKEAERIAEGVWEGCVEMHKVLQELWCEELRSRPKPKSFLDFSDSKIPGLSGLERPKNSDATL